MPTTIEDHTIRTPQTSYGIQKAIGDMFISDYSRKGFIDGRALRLPTIVVRSGKPNQAASTFASSIIREPLQGESVICPVSPDAQMWILSPRQAIKSFIHAAELPAAKWGDNRALNLPGLCVSIQRSRSVSISAGSISRRSGLSLAHTTSYFFATYSSTSKPQRSETC